MGSRPTKRDAIPSVRDDNVKIVAEMLKRNMDIALGLRGDPLDRFVSIRELIESGLARQLKANPAEFGGGITVGKPTSPANRTVPPAPTNLTISSGFSNVILEWDSPYAQYGNHGFTEIWRAAVDDIGQAVRVGTTSSFVYADAVGQTSTNYYYWIRFVSSDNVIGPFNAIDGTLGGTGLVGGADLSDLIITAEKIADGAIDLGGDKITGLLSDINLDVISDPTKIADQLIDTAKLADLAVEAEKLADSSVTATKIANAAVGTAAIQLAAITTALIANAAIGSAQIADAAITEAKIGELAVGSAAIQNGAIVNAKIGDLAVDAAKIAALAVVTAKIADAAVTEAKIENLAVTTAKINNAAITTAKIQDLAVETIKIGDQSIIIPEASFTSGTVDATGTSWTTVASQTITVTSTDPLYLLFSSIIRHTSTSEGDTIQARVLRNFIDTVWAAEVIATDLSTTVDGYASPYSLALVDSPPSASSYTYTVQILAAASFTRCDVSRRSICILGTKGK